MIKFEHLCAGYKKDQVLMDFTCSCKEGEFTAIIGPNGCGKSTLLKTIVKQADLLSGHIFLKGKNLKDWQERERAKTIAYLPQSRNDCHITVERMILHGRFPYLNYPRHYQQEDFKKVEEALRELGIEDLKYRKVGELSGGERQKVYLAMALVQDTEVLLLDEPATYLDMSYQLELMELLRGLKNKGKTIAAVLHDLNGALQYADRVIVMENGRLKANGTPNDIVKQNVLEEVFHIQVETLKNAEGEKRYFFKR